MLALSCFLFSCSDSFINHSVKFEKKGDCTEITSPILITANTNGERYEFLTCADDDFDGKNYTLTRSGDSLIVNFPKTAAKQSLFQITLDIDAKPAYHYISIDGRGMAVSVTRNF